MIVGRKDDAVDGCLWVNNQVAVDMDQQRDDVHLLSGGDVDHIIDDIERSLILFVRLKSSRAMLMTQRVVASRRAATRPKP